MKLLDQGGLSYLIGKIKDLLNLKADKTYVDDRVKTSVPVGAKFTDTLYTHPSMHPYSMITGTPTSLPANGGTSTATKHLLGDDSRSVNSNPSVYMSSGARWGGRAGWQTEFKYRSTIGNPPLTGTYVYLQTHTPWSDPSGGYPIQLVYGNGHPAWRVGISTTAWSDWVSLNDGGNANTVNGKTVGVNVPANAKFTDTVTTINGKTGTISKADIVALGIPSQNTNTTYSEITTAEIDTGTAGTLRAITGRRVKYILDKVQGWIGGLTKSDVGLSNVDNLSAASIRSGTTKANVGLGNVDNTSDLNKPISTATQAVLSNKVDNSRVLTDVPANAKFTDTVLKIVSSPTEPVLKTGDIWHKEI